MPAAAPCEVGLAGDIDRSFRGGLGAVARSTGGGAHDAALCRDGIVDVARAREVARSLIPVGHRRYLHSQAAADAAARVAQLLPAGDRAVLVGAAWLHDVGYHPPGLATGFHPLDRADLLTASGWPVRLTALVAHHSHAQFMASARGLTPRLGAYPREDGLVSDLLTYADMTAGPCGQRLTLRQRLLDVRRRHAGEVPQRAAARRLREPHLVMAVARVDVSLLARGHHGPLALPVPPGRTLPAEALDALTSRQPGRPHEDLQAALHAALSLSDTTTRAVRWDLLVHGADRLLDAATPPP